MIKIRALYSGFVRSRIGLSMPIEILSLILSIMQLATYRERRQITVTEYGARNRGQLVNGNTA